MIHRDLGQHQICGVPGSGQAFGERAAKTLYFSSCSPGSRLELLSSKIWFAPWTETLDTRREAELWGYSFSNGVWEQRAG